MINKLLLFGIGFMVVVSSLIAAHTPINWVYFSVSSSVMALLILLQKTRLKNELISDKNNNLSLDVFEIYLNKMLKELDELSKNEIDENYSNKLTSIIEELLPNINDYRITMINKLGVANYTQIAIPFSKAERLLNRGVSAAIDGYIVESNKSIKNSLQYISNSIDEIEKNKG